jgi:hypothetical protein
MKLSIAEFERRFSVEAKHSHPDITVRDSLLRKARELPKGGHGPNAPPMTERDGTIITLGLIASRQAKDVVDGVKRLKRFVLVKAREEIGDIARPMELPFPKGAFLPDVLQSCFHQCWSHPQFRLLSLRADRSEVDPLVFLAIGYYQEERRPERPIATCLMTFTDSDPLKDHQPDAVEYSSRLRGHALMKIVELLAIDTRNLETEPAHQFALTGRSFR